MITKQSVLRVAAASAATAFLAVGAAAPGQAAERGGGEGHRPATAQGKSAQGKSAQGKSPQGKSAQGKSAQERKSAAGRAAEGGRHEARVLRGSKQPARLTRGNGEADPPKHDPVTVCHLLGNGSYHLLTFDDSALEAHTGHGDLYPVPASGCPAGATVTAADNGRAVTPGALVDGDLVAPDEVLGVATELGSRPAAVPAALLRSETARGGGNVPDRVDPDSGVLPQTGAGEIAGMLLAGLGLLAAGAGLLARRRALS